MFQIFKLEKGTKLSSSKDRFCITVGDWQEGRVSGAEKVSTARYQGECGS